MSITIALPETLDIENYTGLQTFLTDHLELEDSTVAQLPTLIRLAELNLKREIRTPEREVSAALVTVAGEQSVALPTDCLHVRSVRLSDDCPLTAAPLHGVQEWIEPGRPQVFTISNNRMLLGPVPNDVFTLNIFYEVGIPPLTENSQTNWLLASHADAYVYMAASVICQHIGDSANSSLYFGFASGVIESINAEGKRKKYAGPLTPNLSVPNVRFRR